MRTRAGLLLAAALCMAPAVTLGAEGHGDTHGDGQSSHVHHLSLTGGSPASVQVLLKRVGGEQ